MELCCAEPSTPSWPSPETPLLAFSVCTAGFEALYCSTHIFRTNIIPIHPPLVFLVCRTCSLQPGPGILQDAAATLRSMALKHSLVPGQAPGHWEWGLEGAFRQAEDPQRGFSLQGGAVRCDRAAFVQLITLPSPISERSPGAETDQVCFY